MYVIERRTDIITWLDIPPEIFRRRLDPNYLSSKVRKATGHLSTHATSKHHETTMSSHNRKSNKAIPRPSNLGEELLLRYRIRLVVRSCNFEKYFEVTQEAYRLGYPPTGTSALPLALADHHPSFAFTFVLVLPYCR